MCTCDVCVHAGTCALAYVSVKHHTHTRTHTFTHTHIHTHIHSHHYYIVNCCLLMVSLLPFVCAGMSEHPDMANLRTLGDQWYDPSSEAGRWSRYTVTHDSNQVGQELDGNIPECTSTVWRAGVFEELVYSRSWCI